MEQRYAIFEFENGVPQLKLSSLFFNSVDSAAEFLQSQLRNHEWDRWSMYTILPIFY